MSEWLLAGISGAIGASTLLVGAAIAYFVEVPKGIVAGIMAFGAGVLISALAFELVEEANADGGLIPTVLGFLVGASIFVAADWLIARRRTSSRGTPRSGSSGDEDEGGGSAIAVGALIDGIPESIVLGLSAAGTGGLSLPIIAAIAISNIPEGLSSTSDMKQDGRGARYIFGVWGGIALASTAAALLGNLLLSGAPVEVVAFVTTVAAGGILAMLSNTMIPEAFQRDRVLTGLVAALGFVTAFVLHELGG
ncbi:MAG: ZIP family zinc transporter [Naasia sp.]